MPSFSIRRISRIRGNIVFPGDKSIAHRCVILSAISEGRTSLANFPGNDDCLATARVYRSLGAGMRFDRGRSLLRIEGNGLFLKTPAGPLNCGESGTTLRLTLGVLSGQKFSATVTAEPSLQARPMSRVTQPLRRMGAVVSGRRRASCREEFPPVTVTPGSLTGMTHRPGVASAQVKSAILLAGLYAHGTTRIIEKENTRDHTERMLRMFGARVSFRGKTVALVPGTPLVTPGELFIPGDISSAAFFMVLASLLPGSRVILKGVGVNPGRTGIIAALGRMGASLKLTPRTLCGTEPCADITVAASGLRSLRVSASEVPSLVDELPVLMVAAACARGTTILEGIQELRVKESDRLDAMTGNLRRMGVNCSLSTKKTGERLIIEGTSVLRGARVKSFADHRIAMSMAVAGCLAGGVTVIDDISCISKSFPGFLKVLKKVAVRE